MNDTTANNRTAEAADETEAALAGMDLPLAKHLRNLRRRMQGIPLENEREMQEEARETEEMPAAMDNAHVPAITEPEAGGAIIDPDALRLLDDEIAARSRGRAEREALREADGREAAAAKPSGDAAALALQPLKARARRLSPVKRRMIESSVKIGATLPDDIVFQHSVFCQTVLPYRDPGSETRIWERTQGQVYLSLEAGRVKDPQGRFVPVGLPFGPAARLILCHLNTEALRTGSPAVDTGDSLTAFVKRLQGFTPNGYQIRRTKDQLARLAASTIRLAVDRNGHTTQVNTHIVAGLEVWEEHHEGERFLFPKHIVLGLEYAENLHRHAVPLDERAVAALAHSAMGLDVYAWLAQRLHRIDPQRGQFIPWIALYEQFGQGYKYIRQFRAAFLSVLKAVKTQYPAARFKTDKGGMLLANSPPPVPRRHVILLPMSSLKT